MVNDNDRTPAVLVFRWHIDGVGGGAAGTNCKKIAMIKAEARRFLRLFMRINDVKIP